MMWWGGGHWGWEPWVASTLSMLIFWGLAIAAIVFAMRAFSARRNGDAHGQRSSAEGILAERYARGEIDDEEFRRRREALRSMR